MAKHAPHQPNESTPEHLPLLVLPPHEMGTLYLGEFESGRLVPDLEFEYEPDEPGSVTYTEDRRIMHDGTVRVRFYFQNFSAQTVTVHPRRTDNSR